MSAVEKRALGVEMTLLRNSLKYIVLSSLETALGTLSHVQHCKALQS